MVGGGLAVAIPTLINEISHDRYVKKLNKIFLCVKFLPEVAVQVDAIVLPLLNILFKSCLRLTFSHFFSHISLWEKTNWRNGKYLIVIVLLKI